MSSPVSVDCPAGHITGTLPGDGTRRFHSIPYSEIPGDFADATKASKAQKPRIDATTARPAEVALSITTPDAPGRDRPVVVYIHGGRFEHGTHEDPRADGRAAAASGVIVVQLGYRVGLAGFARFHDDEPHRYRGVDDCLLGLEWVQKNIECFGGDPTNVTLLGQSAGASIALWLTRRDHYRGAFRRVIACSPAFPRRGWDERKALLRSALGKPVTRASLSALPPRRVAKAYRRFRTLLGHDVALGPYPLETAEMANVDIVVTATRDEFYELPFPAALDRRGLGSLGVRLLARPLGMSGLASSWMDSARQEDPARLTGRLVGDSMARRWAQYVADGAPGTVWMAEFAGSAERPALHCDELRPLFVDEEHPLHQWLMRFAHTGEPGWAAYDSATGRQAMRMDLFTGEMTPVADPLKSARLAFGEAYPRSASRRR